MDNVVQVPIYIMLALWAVTVLIAWLSTPGFRRGAVAAGDKAEAWGADKSPMVAAVIREAIEFAEENFILLTGPERMERAIAFCVARGVPVTKAQVQAVFDVMKALKLFGITTKAAKEAASNA